jgi:hypothetical protein
MSKTSTGVVGDIDYWDVPLPASSSADDDNDADKTAVVSLSNSRSCPLSQVLLPEIIASYHTIPQQQQHDAVIDASASSIASRGVPHVTNSCAAVNKNISSTTTRRRRHSNLNRTSSSLAHALIPDLPLLMYGSGDVSPANVDPISVATLATYIEQYVGKLICAALDAHDIYTDGQVVGGYACLGPPPFPSSSSAMIGGGGVGGGDNYLDEDVYNVDETVRDDDNEDDENTTLTNKRKERTAIDYWDMPLPPNKKGINDNGTFRTNNDGALDDYDNIGDYYDNVAVGDDDIAAATTSTTPGVVPIDLHSNERTRNYYVTSTSALDVRSFIFPICHDAELYQRVKDIQSTRRSIQRDVYDRTMLDVILDEGRKEGRRGMVDMYDGVLGRDKNNTTAANKKKEVKFNSSYEEKSVDDDNGANIVGAGLVDAGVTPSWPGMDSLLGRL